MLNVSTLIGVATSASDALRYGMTRAGESMPASARERRPVVVWNSTQACNLTCAHCYASAKSRPARDELDTSEAMAFLDDLANFGVPAVLLSGGEPLTRPDLLVLLEHGISRGLRFTLSTNGTLLDDHMASAIAEVGVAYVGISIDGTESTHDHLRRRPGAWRSSVRALGVLGDAGVKRGIRFTLTPDTVADLGSVLEFAVAQRIERVCVYHLVPSGRGRRLVDLSPEQRHRALEEIFEFATAHPEIEVLTVDNPSDGPALYLWLQSHDPGAAKRCRRALEWNGGAVNGPGVGLAAVDERGGVHIDQFSRDHTVGNIRDTPFSHIWTQPADLYLRLLRGPERPVPVRCRVCPGLAMCGGGSRTRALAATRDRRGFDPSCSVSEARPWARPERAYR